MRFKFLVSSVLAFGLASGAHAGLINGDFEDGLNGWEAYDDVTVSNGVATVGDDSAFGISTLAQVNYTGTGLVRFEFDFLASISDETGPYDYPDLFSSSLYFTNDTSSFDLFSGVYDDFEWVLDVDSAGPIVYSGAVSNSAIGLGWMHYSYEFVNSYNTVVAVFDMIDGNLLVDSNIQIDNVSLSAVIASVPEPSSLVLFLSLLGFAGLVRVRTLNIK